MIFVGCDWSRSKHDVIVLDPQGERLGQLTVLHDAAALADLAHKIAELEPDPTEVKVGVELHDGGLLAWLLEQGYSVYAVNPKSAERARDRYRPSGAKDDKSDAFILADMVRTDAGALRLLRAESEITQELGAWLRYRDKLTKQKTAAFHQLRALLAEWCPALSALCGDFNRKWQRDLLAEFPLHQDLCAAHGNRINAFAKKHNLQAATRQRLRQAKATVPLPIPESRIGLLRFQIADLLDTIAQRLAALARVKTELERLISAHPDQEIFSSLPVRGTFTVATLLSAFGQDREAAASWRELAALWGVAPVTKQSGYSRSVKRRRACDHLILQGLLSFAHNTAFTAGCWAGEYYQAKRERGAEHYTTLRCLAQRWVKILYRMWKDRVPYCEQLHQANRQLHAAAAT